MGIISPKLLSMTYATRGEGVNVCWGRGDGRQKKKGERRKFTTWFSLRYSQVLLFFLTVRDLPAQLGIRTVNLKHNSQQKENVDP